MNMTTEEIDIALDDLDWLVRCKAVEQANIKTYQIDIALNDPDWSVREAAINSPNATLDQVNKGLFDKKLEGLQYAQGNENAAGNLVGPLLQECCAPVDDVAKQAEQG
jgi:hypothetical protein